jgi:hypothetical protein
MCAPQKITDEQRDGRRLLVWAAFGDRMACWWPAEWQLSGDYGPGWYPGVYDSSEGFLGFQDEDVTWWLPMPKPPTMNT